MSQPKNKKVCTFFGHRQIFNNEIENRLYLAVENCIQSGIKSFLIGTLENLIN